jgi:chemotaxis signal transduction protein
VVDQPLTIFFRAAGERYAMYASDVLKVVGQARLCRLPRLPAPVLGITHHRGRIVTVVDVGGLFAGGDRRDATDASRVLVLDRGQRNLGLRVDAVEHIEPMSLSGERLAGRVPAISVVQHQGRAVNAIDTDRLLDAILALAGEGLVL